MVVETVAGPEMGILREKEGEDGNRLPEMTTAQGLINTHHSQTKCNGGHANAQSEKKLTQAVGTT